MGTFRRGVHRLVPQAVNILTALCFFGAVAGATYLFAPDASLQLRIALLALTAACCYVARPRRACTQFTAGPQQSVFRLAPGEDVAVSNDAILGVFYTPAPWRLNLMTVVARGFRPSYLDLEPQELEKFLSWSRSRGMRPRHSTLLIASELLIIASVLVMLASQASGELSFTASCLSGGTAVAGLLFALWLKHLSLPN